MAIKPLERPEVTLGFIPLTDCAPLVVAKELGLFQRHGLSVTLSREASWANIRDKVALGALDGAHMLATMPLAESVGSGPIRRPVVTAFSLGLGGNAITLSKELTGLMLRANPEAARDPAQTAGALKAVIEADRFASRPGLTFAHVFPGSTHELQLRYWLATGGINPDTEVRLTVVPPPQMVNALGAGRIAGYCVGEPWNTRAWETGLGRGALASFELWNNHPEKVLGVSRVWAEQNPNTHRLLIMALLEAAQWLDVPGNRLRAARMLAKAEYVNAPLPAIRQSLEGAFCGPDEIRSLPDFHVFFRHAANFPWRSHAEWLLKEMVRWGHITDAIDIRAKASEVYWTDTYREAAQALGITCPSGDRKSEGLHSETWKCPGDPEAIPMGADRFLDGAVFDPDELTGRGSLGLPMG